jgi:hypothetical protein
MTKEKRDIQPLIEKEEEHLHNILPTEDVKAFKAMVGELRDTWTKKQIFRTETEARISVLQDMKYPTKAAKYWQCVREQNVFLENLMSLSFDYRRNDIKIKRLEKKIEEEKDDLKKELWKIDLDEKIYAKANMELTAKDRMRELKMWSKLKTEFNDGTFDTQDVNKHQLDSYAKIMQNKAKTLTDGSSQPEVFNVLGQEMENLIIKREKLFLRNRALEKNPVNQRQSPFYQKVKHKIKQMNKIINPLITVKEGDKYKILAGNNRFLAGLELGHTEFPIKVIEGETPQDIRKAMEDYIPIDLDEV